MQLLRNVLKANRHQRQRLTKPQPLTDLYNNRTTKLIDLQGKENNRCREGSK